MSVFDQRPYFECHCINGTNYELHRNGKAIHIRQDVAEEDPEALEGGALWEPWMVLDPDKDPETWDGLVAIHQSFDEAMKGARDYLMQLEVEAKEKAVERERIEREQMASRIEDAQRRYAEDVRDTVEICRA